jgi:hypothetical protein
MRKILGVRPWNRIARPSKKAALIAVLLIGTISSAFLLGSNFGKEEDIGYLSSSSHVYDIMPESRGDMSISEAQAAVDTAALAAADSTKSAATGLSSMLSLVSRPADAGQEGEIAAEPAEVIFERMVIFTAKLRLEVEDVELAVYEIRLIAEECGGFVAGMSTSKSEWGVMTLRVPQDEFYDAIEGVEALGNVEERELKGEDITDTFVDLEAQLANLRREEERLVEILDMAINVEEVLKVEAELNRVRGEIERITGELKYIEGRVELATITVSLVEESAKERALLPRVDWWAPINTGLQALATVTQGLLTMAIFLGPFVAVGLPVYVLYKRGVKGEDAPLEEAPLRE